MIVDGRSPVYEGRVRQDKRASDRGYPFVCTSFFAEADGVSEAVFYNLLISLCRLGGCFGGCYVGR